ncbi:DUF465 domain-containing protein [Azospirillaceae bacterium]
MSSEDRIESLRVKHKHVDDELRKETQRPLPDAAAIATLKREKLRLKDEISRLTSSPV